MSRARIVMIRLALLALVLAAWELLPRHGALNPLLLPPLGDVLHTLGNLLQRAQVHEALGVTAAEVEIGRAHV